MNPLTAHIAMALKEARERKSLSQRELSARSGVPQAKISRIEREGVDMQITTLIALGRALDLEVELVPRKALPAVETIVRSTATPLGDAGKSFRELRLALQKVDTAHIPAATLDKLMTDLRTLANIPGASEAGAEAKRFAAWLATANAPDLETLNRHAAELARWRKQLLDAPLPASQPKPAYSLDDEGDDDA
jgi:transcriptional regulator with XRE-family HTH domain